MLPTQALLHDRRREGRQREPSMSESSGVPSFEEMLAREKAARAARQRANDEARSQANSRARSEANAARATELEYQEAYRLFREEAQIAANKVMAIRQQDVQVAKAVGPHNRRSISSKIGGWAIDLRVESDILDQYVPTTSYSIVCHILTPAGRLYRAHRFLSSAPRAPSDSSGLLKKLRRGGTAREIEPYNLRSAQEARSIIAGFIVDCERERGRS
jgi:hypothetical protein